QFPLKVSIAMTINKSPEQPLTKVNSSTIIFLIDYVEKQRNPLGDAVIKRSKIKRLVLSEYFQ
ncbi:hypothetical protein MAM1_0632c11053, partial [Mucor ambiguus]